MNYIINSFLTLILKEAEGVFSYAMNMQFDLVFRTEDSITGIFFASITPTLYYIGIALMVMMFLKKGFGVYVLWTDGDPDIEPSAYLMNFIKAIITATCFPYLYGLFVDVCEEILTLIMDKISEHASTYSDLLLVAGKSLSSGGIVLVFVIAYIILFFSLLVRGIELLILKVGVPLACVGLLDNDRGVFKSYFNQFVKVFVTTIIQLVLAKMSCSIMFLAQTEDIFGTFLGLVCIVVAIKTPRLVSEFLLQTGNGGQRLTSLVYVASMAKGLLR